MRDYRHNRQLFSGGLSRHPTIVDGDSEIRHSTSTLYHQRYKSKEVRYNICAETDVTINFSPMEYFGNTLANHK